MTTTDEITVAVGEAIQAVSATLALAKTAGTIDARSLAVARTHFETAFLWLATALDGGGVIDG